MIIANSNGINIFVIASIAFVYAEKIIPLRIAFSILIKNIAINTIAINPHPPIVTDSLLGFEANRLNRHARNANGIIAPIRTYKANLVANSLGVSFLGICGLFTASDDVWLLLLFVALTSCSDIFRFLLFFDKV